LLHHRCTISKINKPLSYTRSRELLLEAVSGIGLDKILFGSSSDMKKNTLGWRVCNKPVETKGESTKY
jgi:hypothetical protein